MQYEKSCGGVVFTRNNDEIRYVIIQHLGGHWGFPKGHMELGETEENTALREIQEEIGISAKLIDGFRVEEQYPLPNKPGTTKMVVYFLAEYTGQEISHQEQHYRQHIHQSDHAQQLFGAALHDHLLAGLGTRFILCLGLNGRAGHAAAGTLFTVVAASGLAGHGDHGIAAGQNLFNSCNLGHLLFSFQAADTC